MLRAIADRKAQKGFTIIELMMVVVIVGILASIAAPSMREMLIRQRVRTVSSDLYASLTLTRSEAIKRNATVTLGPVCASPPCAATDWVNGWTVTTVSGGSTITLETKDAPASVVWSAPASIVFGASGRTTGTSNVEFRFSSSEYPAVPMRCIAISPSGRPNIRTDSDGNGANGCT